MLSDSIKTTWKEQLNDMFSAKPQDETDKIFSKEVS